MLASVVYEFSSATGVDSGQKRFVQLPLILLLPGANANPKASNNSDTAMTVIFPLVT